MILATKWRDDVRTALLNRPIKLTLDRISEDTGLGRAWLGNFACGKSPDPGICKVETLHNYLKKQSN